MQRKMEVRRGVGAKPFGCAIAGKGKAPAQNVRDRAVAQQQRRIFLAKPFDDLGWHAGLRPWLDLAGMDDAAIAPARLHARFSLTLNQHHVMAGFSQIPGSRGANGASAQNHDSHGLFTPQVRASYFGPGPWHDKRWPQAIHALYS